MSYLRFSSFILLLALASACSHKFDSNVLDLSFYQWNLWADMEAVAKDGAPSCGWDDLHRGKGKLVRIPALIQEHYTSEEVGDVYWYHCRFTLPEGWEEREVSLSFEGVGPATEVYLNEEQVLSYEGKVEVDVNVSEVIYYTRDNHMAIKVSASDAEGSKGLGISGSVLAKSKIAP